MSDWRRYEILLPLKFNDGRAVPRELLSDTLLKLEERFGAVSCETQVIQGSWHHGQERFRDDLVRAFVDVEDRPQNREFFRTLKEELKSKFQQLDVWIVTYKVDIV